LLETHLLPFNRNPALQDVHSVGELAQVAQVELHE
jgi:hypothetical protein